MSSELLKGFQAGSCQHVSTYLVPVNVYQHMLTYLLFGSKLESLVLMS